MSDLLCVEGVSKTYDHAPLLREISFGVAAGEIVCLLGPSGTGKTTLLRIIAGLEEADAGRIVFEGKDLDGVPPHERGFGMMFQDLALFPHKNVFENVAFGLRMMHGPRRAGEITTRVNEALKLVGLDAARFAGRDVNRLSGGEQQRVALARTLAPRPRLIMFDEPLGALDRILREDLVGELRALLKRLHMTALYVTHDQDEAFAIADRLVLLNAGRIEQMGTPIELYAHPANAFVARFMGLTNLVEIKDWRIEAGVFPADWKTDKGMRELETGERENGGQNAVARTDVGRFIIDAARVPERGAKYVLLRPKALERIVETSERAANVLRGRVTEMQWRGGQQRIVVDAQGHEFAFEVDAPVAAGREVVLELKASEIDFLPAE